MANNETTTKFKVDISELKKAMQDAKRQVALANSEFKAVSSSMDDWTKSSDGLSAKLKQLDSNLKSQKTILKSLEDQYELTVAEMGEGSKAAEDLKIKINNQKSVVNSVERDISKYNDTLKDVVDAEAEAAKTGKSVADILDDVGDSAEDAEGGFTVLKGAVATFAGNVLTGLVDGLKDAASNLLGLADSTREYRTEMAKLETSFESAGFSTEATTDTFKELYGVMADEGAATEAAQQLAKFSDTEADLKANTRILTGVMAEYGNSIPLEGLAEGMAASAAMGEVQGSLADALEWQGVNLDEFNDKLGSLSTDQERAALIQSTLTDLYGASADAYRDNNASVIEANEAQLELNDTMADMGEKVEPVTTTLKKGFNSVLEKILELMGDGDITKWTDKIEDGFSVITDDVLPAIKKGFQWIIDNKDILLAAIAGIATGMLAWNVVGIITSVVAAIKGWIIATEGMTLAQRLLNLVMNANPIGIIITLISGLVAAFIVLWNKSDAFREFWINLWDKIKEKTSKIVTAIGNFFSNLWKSITETFSSIGEWFGEKWDAIKEGASNVKEKISSFFSEAWSSIKNTFSSIGTWFSDKFQGAYNKIVDIFSGIGSFFTSIWNKIKDIFSKVGETIGGAVSDAFSTAINWVLEKAIGIINGFIGAINTAIGVINAIPGVEIDKLDKLDVPQLAKGGITTGATLAEIGEAGREAVLPLERNTGWMKLLAKQLVAEMRGTDNITGITQSAGSGTTYNFYQTNNSPKTLSRLEIYRQTKNILTYAGGGY